MSNIKIGPKLIVSFLFIAALTAFIGLYLLNGLETLQEQTEVIYQKGAIPLGMLVTTNEKVQEMRFHTRNWRLAKTDKARAEAMKKF
ncbi:MAG: MCP four helix bundle domain-containing protein, partial [Fibromonadaceae bacterium]|nr:MCP four helix bundle domain-containing protein [Fibromonadaceae bacterium]